MKTIVIGGGAAGCYAAIHAAYAGEEVLLIEKNPVIGKKLRITGKGRCNLTNDCDLETLMQNIPCGGRFLYSAFAACSPQNVMAYFEGLGVRLKVERGNRVFPVSDQAAEVVNALYDELKRTGVQLITGTVTELCIAEGICNGVKCGDREYHADRVILAAGGSTYPATGSDGSGCRLAAQAGHTISPLRPSLVPLETLERDCAEMMGISLKNVTLRLKCDGKTVYEELGEMLFTHFGVSGPLVLSASAHMEKQGLYTLHIDMKPALDMEQLDKRLQREIAAQPNKQLPSLMRKLVPAGMVSPMLGRCAFPPYLRGNSLTKEQRHRICEVLKDFSFTVRGTRPIAEGIITRGGVLCKEVSPKTMESKLVKGLYFAGEVLDVDAYTGGFNLQIAFATAYLAANASISYI
ncbi:MAG: NAD(P)/FAD-dependent oxidoreductase [Oscillospiraceae bacterium]|nr:NAD(P)/FAD-dependent oxidoreductase [Oscillospiraceae bacterium]